MDFSHLPIKELLREGGFNCACGKHHAVALKWLEIGCGAIDKLPKRCVFAGPESLLSSATKTPMRRRRARACAS
jgi:hypothetical protein